MQLQWMLRAECDIEALFQQRMEGIGLDGCAKDKVFR